VNPVEFLAEPDKAASKLLGQSVGKDFVIIAGVFLTQYQRVTD